MNLRHIYHLYHRAGFGISIEEAKKLQNLKTEEIVSSLLQIKNQDNALKLIPLEQMPKMAEMKCLSANEKKDLQKKAREKDKDLNVLWIKQLINSPDPLLEKTTLFWHGHLACRVDNPYMSQELNNIQRKFAFAPFKELLISY